MYNTTTYKICQQKSQKKKTIIKHRTKDTLKRKK